MSIRLLVGEGGCIWNCWKLTNKGDQCWREPRYHQTSCWNCLSGFVRFNLPPTRRANWVKEELKCKHMRPLVGPSVYRQLFHGSCASARCRSIGAGSYQQVITERVVEWIQSSDAPVVQLAHWCWKCSKSIKLSASTHACIKRNRASGGLELRAVCLRGRDAFYGWCKSRAGSNTNPIASTKQFREYRGGGRLIDTFIAADQLALFTK